MWTRYSWLLCNTLLLTGKHLTKKIINNQCSCFNNYITLFFSIELQYIEAQVDNFCGEIKTLCGLDIAGYTDLPNVLLIYVTCRLIELGVIILSLGLILLYFLIKLKIKVPTSEMALSNSLFSNIFFTHKFGQQLTFTTHVATRSLRIETFVLP